MTHEELTERFYFVKTQRDKMMWKLSTIADMAADELRRFGPQPNSNVPQIEADARAVLDEVRGQLAELSSVQRRGHSGTAIPIVCGNCGEESTNPGQFVADGRWVCCNECRRHLVETQ